MANHWSFMSFLCTTTKWITAILSKISTSDYTRSSTSLFQMNKQHFLVFLDSFDNLMITVSMVIVPKIYSSRDILIFVKKPDWHRLV